MGFHGNRNTCFKATVIVVIGQGIKGRKKKKTSADMASPNGFKIIKLRIKGEVQRFFKKKLAFVHHKEKCFHKYMHCIPHFFKAFPRFLYAKKHRTKEDDQNAGKTIFMANTPNDLKEEHTIRLIKDSVSFVL